VEEVEEERIEGNLSAEKGVGDDSSLSETEKMTLSRLRKVKEMKGMSREAREKIDLESTKIEREVASWLIADVS